ncbi:MAG: hypothetical protein AAB565_00595 [Patescibacteria group bacterium]
MNHKKFSLVAGIIFLLIFILHLFRLIRGWDGVIGDWVLPMWLSWVALVITGYLAYKGLKLSGK